MRNALFAAALLLLPGCRSEAPAPSAPTAPVRERDADERPNLLNIAYGASVVSRTAELELEHSALRAIDGESAYPDAKWVTVPDDTNQMLVFGLPAPTRIEELGLITQPGVYAVGSPAFEVSMDGRRYQRIPLAPFEAKLELQLRRLEKPVDARYVRVIVGETAARFATLMSVQARGRLSEPPAVHSIAGCWTVNGLEASFVEENGEVHGTVGDHVLIGGRDGAVYRFAWTNGPNWGHALVTLSPDGTHLSAMKWFEEPIAYNAAESWFGEKCSGAPSRGAGSRGEIAQFLTRAKRFPLYGNAVETVLNVLRQAPSQRIRLVSREYRASTAEENRLRAKERLDRLRTELQAGGADLTRIDFEVAGNDSPYQPIENESMRVLYGAIEIEP